MAQNPMAQTLTVRTLGRRFGLGDFYDVRSGDYVGGFTLWNRSSLRSEVRQFLYPRRFTKVTTANTFDAKANFLGLTSKEKLELTYKELRHHLQVDYCCNTRLIEPLT